MHGLMRGRWKRSNGRGDSGTRRRKGEKQTEPLPTATAPVLYSTQVRVTLALFGTERCHTLFFPLNCYFYHVSQVLKDR